MSISAPTLLHAVAGWLRTIDKCAGTWRIINVVDVTIRISPWIPYPAYEAAVRVRSTSFVLRFSQSIYAVINRKEIHSENKARQRVAGGTQGTYYALASEASPVICSAGRRNGMADAAEAKGAAVGVGGS